MNKGWVPFGIVLAVVLGINLESIAAQKKQPKAAELREQPKAGGTLVVGLGKEPANPNPFIATMSITQVVRETSYESLLTQDDYNRIVPNLAEAFETSSGGTEFTLHLRKGVKFHNGKEMKADDVIWSANHVKDPINGALGQNMIKDVKSFDKIDDYTVKFTLSTPSVTFLSYLADIRMLPILPVNSLQPGQIKLERNAFVPGTGPFILEQFQPGFDTVVKKYPEYWGSPAYLDKIIFRPIIDATNRFNALRTGDVQLADRLAPLDVDRVKKGEVKGIVIVDEPLAGLQQLTVNYNNPLFQKVSMRQALLYSIDKQRLVDEVFFSHAKPTDMMMNSESIWTKAAKLPRHKRDLVKAKALLKAAGYNGQELVLIGRTASAKLYESLQRMFSEAGIKVKLEILEAGVKKDRYIAGKYDLNIDGGNVTSEPVDTMLPYYYTNKIDKGHYSNPKVDQLFDKLNTEFDEKKRLKIFKELQGTISNDVANIPLLNEVRYVGMSEKVQGFGPTKGHDYVESGNYYKNVWLK